MSFFVNRYMPGNGSGGSGSPGPQGPIGPEGPMGLTGPKGDKGDKGDTGNNGLDGIQGAQGVPGPQGSEGPQGATGLTGAQGPRGLQGERGQGFQVTHVFTTLAEAEAYATTAVNGEFISIASTTSPENGNVYITMNNALSFQFSAQGIQGPQGVAGIDGAQGAQGLRGLQGLPGAQGPQGVAGAVGPRGLQGDRGLQGLKGDKGDKGDTGLQGPQGATGPQGIQGERGLQGPQGATPVIPAKEYLVGGRITTSQVISANGTDMIFNRSLGGNIPLDINTGEFTLTAGKTYRITCSPEWSFSGAVGYIDITLVNALNQVAYTSLWARFTPVTSTANESTQGPFDTIYTVPTTGKYKMRAITVQSLTATHKFGFSKLVIQEI